MEDDRKPKHACDGCCSLNFEVMPANRPSMIAAPFWAQATAEGEVCGQGNEGHIQISARGLVILASTLHFLPLIRDFFLQDLG